MSDFHSNNAFPFNPCDIKKFLKSWGRKMLKIILKILVYRLGVFLGCSKAAWYRVENRVDDSATIQRFCRREDSVEYF